MGTIGTMVGLIIIANLYMTYRGLKDRSFMDHYAFEVDPILIHKDYKRLITSGFLHVSWTHLLFNMVSLYFFGPGLESVLGPWRFLLVYFGSLVGGDLLSLFIHRHHGDYSAVGASGAVCGLVFAAIAIFPGMEIGIWGLPVTVPAWAYGLFYVLFSIYGIKSQRDNIGHDAHLGGGLVGLLLAVVMLPGSLVLNFMPIAAILVPAVAFLYIIITRPHFLLVDNLFVRSRHDTKDERYNARKATQAKEIDRILDKISARGIDSISKRERDILDSHARRSVDN